MSNKKVIASFSLRLKGKADKKFKVIYANEIEISGITPVEFHDFLNKNKLRPFIIFEYIHINHEILNKTLNTLKEKKFFYFKIDENIISVPEEKKNLVSFFN